MERKSCPIETRAGNGCQDMEIKEVGTDSNGHITTTNEKEQETLMGEKPRVNPDHPGHMLTKWQRIFASCTICLTTLTCVCGLSVIGPTLLDLKTTTGGSGLKVVSWLLSAQAFGSILGCLLAGTTLEQCMPWLQMSVSHILGSVSLVLLPIVSNIEAAMLLAVLSGACLGFVPPGTLILIFKVWPEAKNANSWVCAETLFYCMGPLVSAAVSGPFMAPPETVPNTTIANLSTMEYTTSSVTPVDTTTNRNTSQEVDVPEIEISRIAIAYGILSCMGVVSIVLLLLVHFTTQELKRPNPGPSPDKNKSIVHSMEYERKHTRMKNILIIGSYLVYICHSIFTFSFGHFLVVFTVGHFNWSRSKGALITTVYWIVNLFGKVVGMGLVRCVPNEAILFTAVIGVNACLLGLVLTIDTSEVSIWSWTVLIASFSTFCDPCCIIWIEKYIGMRGRVAAIPDIGVKSGDLIAAPLIGWLAQEIDYMYIIYLVWGSAAMCLFLLVGLQLVGRTQIVNKDKLFIETNIELE